MRHIEDRQRLPKVSNLERLLPYIQKKYTGHVLPYKTTMYKNIDYGETDFDDKRPGINIQVTKNPNFKPVYPSDKDWENADTSMFTEYNYPIPDDYFDAVLKLFPDKTPEEAIDMIIDHENWPELMEDFNNVYKLSQFAGESMVDQVLENYRNKYKTKGIEASPTGIHNPADYMKIVQEDKDGDGDIDKMTIEEEE